MPISIFCIEYCRNDKILSKWFLVTYNIYTSIKFDPMLLKKINSKKILEVKIT